jgi:hypothetical protein
VETNEKNHSSHIIVVVFWVMDPIAPLDEAPDGIPTLTDWKFQKNSVGGGVESSGEQ